MRRFSCLSCLLAKSLVVAALSMLVSCASLSPNGVGRIKRYNVEHEQLPPQFDGYTVAFVSDIHYRSKFTQKRLARLVRALNEERACVLLLGGDYVTSEKYLEELFGSISEVAVQDGVYAVLGNHERRNGNAVAAAMEHAGITLLADSVAVVERDGARLHIAGVRDSFSYDSAVVQPAETVADSLFTILLCHTPDYAELSSTTADIALSGHTHGGQVSLFGLYTPVRNSRYGTRFLRGLNTTTGGTVVITTNGVGTSRRKIRFWVPSEIVVVTLRRKAEK